MPKHKVSFDIETDSCVSNSEIAAAVVLLMQRSPFPFKRPSTVSCVSAEGYVTLDSKTGTQTGDPTEAEVADVLQKISLHSYHDDAFGV